MDHLLTVTFASPEAAGTALARLSADSTAATLRLDDACIITRDLHGAVHVGAGGSDEASDQAFWRVLVEDLALDGTPGDGNATAELPGDFVRRLASALPPGRSALLALTNGIDLDPLLVAIGRHERVLQCELGDGGGAALRDRLAPATPDTPVWPQSGFGSFQ